MAPMTPRDDWPAARAPPRYRDTASLDDRPSCQARSAASDAASGSDTGVADTDRPVFTAGSLRHWHGYAAKVSYLAIAAQLGAELLETGAAQMKQVFPAVTQYPRWTIDWDSMTGTPPSGYLFGGGASP